MVEDQVEDGEENQTDEAQCFFLREPITGFKHPSNHSQEAEEDCKEENARDISGEIAPEHAHKLRNPLPNQTVVFDMGIENSDGESDGDGVDPPDGDRSPFSDKFQRAYGIGILCQESHLFSR